MTRASEAAATLRKILGEPIYNRTLKKEVGRGELDYEIYLRTRELLALQTPETEQSVHDELVFQVQHQTQELWLKCVAYEGADLVDALDRDAIFDALGALERIVAVSRALAEQIRILFTLTPTRFHVIRTNLGNGSGLESPGYNQVHASADASWEALARLIARRGCSLLDVYANPDRAPDVHRLAERFVDWDGAFQSWLIEHFMLVRRTLGVDKTVRGLDGFPTVALSARMTRPLFPELWNARVEMSRAWSRDGGFAPGEPRVGAGTRPPVAEAPPRDVRDEFPLLATCVYLNSNATGVAPRAVKGVLDAYWHTIETWRDEVWERWWQDLADHADAIAALIGAPSGSVVCDSNLATLFGRVMTCFDFATRPRVVSSDLEFPSLPFVIKAFGRYGAVPVAVSSRDASTIDPADVVRVVDERTQLVCLSHATFQTGALLDVAPIVARAHEVGALVLLDCYASVGTVPIDVAALDADFVLGGAHKWLCGSYESAFLYVRPSLLPRLEPAATGWIASADPFSWSTPSAWADTARRFASGTPAVLPSLVSRPGLAIVRELGMPAIRRRSLAFTDRIIAHADDARLPVATPRVHDRRGGIVALRFGGDAEVARALVASGFICSYRGGLRIAPHFYNTDHEIDRFMAELVRLVRKAS